MACIKCHKIRCKNVYLKTSLEFHCNESFTQAICCGTQKRSSVKILKSIEKRNMWTMRKMIRRLKTQRHVASVNTALFILTPHLYFKISCTLSAQFTKTFFSLINKTK
jgi:hypothetical protein